MQKKTNQTKPKEKHFRDPKKPVMEAEEEKFC